MFPLFSGTMVHSRAKTYFIRCHYFWTFILLVTFRIKILKLTRENWILSATAASARDREIAIITNLFVTRWPFLTTEINFSCLNFLYRLFKLQESDKKWSSYWFSSYVLSDWVLIWRLRPRRDEIVRSKKDWKSYFKTNFWHTRATEMVKTSL